MYKVIGEVIYTIIDYYICLDYMVFMKEKSPKHDNNFEKTNFNNFYVLEITDILMNIMSCHGFYKS